MGYATISTSNTCYKKDYYTDYSNPRSLLSVNMTQFLNIDKKKDKREENQPQNIES